MPTITITFDNYITAYAAICAARDGTNKASGQIVANSACPLSPFDVIGIWHSTITQEFTPGEIALVREIAYDPETGGAEWESDVVTRSGNDPEKLQFTPGMN